MENLYDSIIIGSGPAGYTAAIYLGRADIKHLIVTGLEPGGQLTTTTDVENFPGYPEGIDGPTMMQDLQKQAERFGSEIKIGYISAFYPNYNNKGIHKLQIDNQDELFTKSVIIATGATAKYLGLESEQKLKGGGVSACAVCDGFFFKGQDVAVVGGGDTALEEASYLSKICRNVALIVRKDTFRASKALQNRVNQIDNITIHFNSEVIEVLGTNVVNGITIKNNKNHSTTNLNITGLFIAIGHKPNTDMFKSHLDMDLQGYLITKGKSSRTNIEGVFACGDAQDKEYRQAITAAGSGCMAALDSERYLASL